MDNCTKCDKRKPYSAFTIYERKSPNMIKVSKHSQCDSCRREIKNQYEFPVLFVGDTETICKLDALDEDYIVLERNNKITIQTYDLRNKNKIKELLNKFLENAYD